MGAARQAERRRDPYHLAGKAASERKTSSRAASTADLISVDAGAILALQASAGNSAVSELLATQRPPAVSVEEAYSTIRGLLEKAFYTSAVETTVIGELQQVAEQGGLDRLLYRLKTTTTDIGIVRSQVTSYYALMLNHFSRADDVRAIRDKYSKNFIGDEPVAEDTWFGKEEHDFLGGFWRDVESGQVANEIVNYFLGLTDAGVGLAEGVWKLLSDPVGTALAIWHLPSTLTILWNHRDELWGEFKAAPPEQQARVVGRIFGNAEILIASVAAGGASGALKVPVPAEALVPAGAAGVLAQGGTISIPLAVLGKGAQISVLMAKATELGTEGKGKADALGKAEPATGGNVPPTDAPVGLSQMFPKDTLQRLQEFLRTADAGDIPAANPDSKALTRAALEEYKRRAVQAIDDYQQRLGAASDEADKVEWQRKIKFQQNRLGKVDQALKQWKFDADAGAPVLKGPNPDVEASDLPQQMALAAARDGQGEVIMRDLADKPRLVAVYGDGDWVKMQYVLRNSQSKAAVTVHYFKNLTTGQMVEFKFK